MSEKINQLFQSKYYISFITSDIHIQIRIKRRKKKRVNVTSDFVASSENNVCSCKTLFEFFYLLPSLNEEVGNKTREISRTVRRYPSRMGINAEGWRSYRSNRFNSLCPVALQRQVTPRAYAYFINEFTLVRNGD